MRPDSRPTIITINLPSLDDAAVVEIQDFLYEVLDLVEAHYGRQIQRFYKDRSFDNLLHPDPNSPTDDPPL